jgi:Fe-S cluster assembly iron-binding protein IscA
VLRITPDAAILVRSLLDDASLPAGAGLRIVTDPACHSLSMSLAATKATEDTEVTRGEARLFLSPSVARGLTRRTLCAEITAERSVFFLNREKPPGWATRRKAAD